MKKFSDLTEREVLTVAIASEEDGRIYMSSQRTSDSYHNCASRRFSERYVMIRIVTWFTWLLVFGWACAAHASPVPPADPVWSTDRIARLPREVRERVLSACGPQARAGHYFATYVHTFQSPRLPPELRGSVAGPLVRRGEEIETALVTSEIFAELQAPSLNLGGRRGSRRRS
jgi:hypothetical protein